MTMHLVRGMTTTGKRRGKQQFRNAQQAKQARELDAEWQALNAKWASTSKFSSTKKQSAPAKQMTTLSPPPGRETTRIASLNTWTTGPVNSKPSQQYTGTKLLGISTLHKSNAVPVFTEQEAIDIARMRR